MDSQPPPEVYSGKAPFILAAVKAVAGSGQCTRPQLQSLTELDTSRAEHGHISGVVSSREFFCCQEEDMQEDVLPGCGLEVGEVSGEVSLWMIILKFFSNISMNDSLSQTFFMNSADYE